MTKKLLTGTAAAVLAIAGPSTWASDFEERAPRKGGLDPGKPMTCSRYTPIAKPLSDDWHVDWDAALLKSKREGKNLFVWSDHNHICEHSDKRKLVFDPAFLNYARENLVLMYFCNPNNGACRYEPEQAVQFKVLSSAFCTKEFNLFSSAGKRLTYNLYGQAKNPTALVRILKKADGTGLDAESPKLLHTRRILFEEGYSNLAARLSIPCETNAETWATDSVLKQLASKKYVDKYRGRLPNPKWCPTWECAVANARKSRQNILVILVGTDWCRYSRAFVSDVLKKKTFSNATKKLEVVYLDLLRDCEASALSGSVPRSYVRETARRLGFDDIIPHSKLFDSTGKTLLGDFPGYIDADALIQRIKELSSASKLTRPSRKPTGL